MGNGRVLEQAIAVVPVRSLSVDDNAPQAKQSFWLVCFFFFVIDVHFLKVYTRRRLVRHGEERRHESIGRLVLYLKLIMSLVWFLIP